MNIYYIDITNDYLHAINIVTKGLIMNTDIEGETWVRDS